MVLNLLITIARLYKCYLGLEYIWVQKYKPKWNESHFADKKENAVEIEEMEYNFQDWNRNMRIRLEQYFRMTWNVTLAYTLQSTLIIYFFFDDLKAMPVALTVISSICLIFDSYVSYILLQIKIKDMRREWKRNKTYVYSASTVNSSTLGPTGSLRVPGDESQTLGKMSVT